MYADAKVAVIVPAYREASRLGATVNGIPPFVDAIYVVDDASEDDTWHVLAQLDDARLTRIRHRRNLGVGASIVTGYQHALRDGAEILVVMAGDNQMDPEDLPRLIEPIARGRASYVKGNRFRHAEARRMPLERRMAGKALAVLTRHATGLDVDDTQCGYTALSARCARELPLAALWPRYGYPNDLLALLARGRFSVVEVPVRPVYAGEKSGVRPWHAALIAGLVIKRWVEHRAPPSAAGARRL